MNAREKLLKRFMLEALRTLRLVRIFTDRDLSIRPAEGSMSTAELIEHIAASQNFTRGLFAEPTPTTELFRRCYDVSSAASAAQAVAGSIKEVRKALEECPEEWLEQRIAPFGPDWELSRVELAHLMVDHEIHHRGQLYVYARIAGHQPPVLYAPVSEEVLEL